MLLDDIHGVGSGVRGMYRDSLLYSLDYIDRIRSGYAYWLNDLLMVVLMDVTDRVDDRGVAIASSIAADGSSVSSESRVAETRVPQTGIADSGKTEGATVVTGWLRLRLSEHCSGQQCDELVGNKGKGAKKEKKRAVPNYWSVEITLKRELDKTCEKLLAFARLIQAAAFAGLESGCVTNPLENQEDLEF